MRTIFIVISRGLLARNVFGTDMFGTLRADPNVRLVLFLPKGATGVIRKELNDSGVIFEEYEETGTNRLKKIFIFFLRFSLITRTGMNLAWYGSGKAYEYRWLYAAAFPVLALLSVIPKIREIFQFLERSFYPEHQYDRYFASYKPVLVVLTNIAGQIDTSFIKAARRQGVKSVAMTKGWDNLDKYHMQQKADALIVQSEPMVAYAVKYQGYRLMDVFVAGFPSFDNYRRSELKGRKEEVCRAFGIDPVRKILFYGSEGVWSSNDTEIVRKLVSWIEENAFCVPCSLIVRPHFSDLATHSYNEFKGVPNVFVYDTMRFVDGFSDRWYPSKDEDELFAKVMDVIDIMVCVRSTLSLDALACGKPVINVTKGAYIDVHGVDRTMNLYRHIFYRDLLALGGVTLAGKGQSLIDAVNRYLKDPEADREEREATVRIYCGGRPLPHSGQKIASHLLSM